MNTLEDEGFGRNNRLSLGGEEHLLSFAHRSCFCEGLLQMSDLYR
jgi:hypothetical protein